MRKLAAIVFLSLISFLCVASAQDAVPTEILQRTIRIAVGNETGTAFAVDYQGKMYLVTARHVVAGVPDRNAIIKMWQDNQWKDYQTVKTIYPSSDDVDIAVFETNEKIEKPYWVKTGGTTGGPTMGQQVWFLGYPWGISSLSRAGKLPLS
jgi:hypothetical protein